jgi:hypothetical protein
MELDGISWSTDAVIRLTIEYRSHNQDYLEVFVGGDEAKALWFAFSGYLQHRIRELLKMKELEGTTPKNFYMNSGQIIELDEVASIHVEDGDGRTWDFRRYEGKIKYPTSSNSQKWNSYDQQWEHHPAFPEVSYEDPAFPVVKETKHG